MEEAWLVVTLQGVPASLCPGSLHLVHTTTCHCVG